MLIDSSVAYNAEDIRPLPELALVGIVETIGTGGEFQRNEPEDLRRSMCCSEAERDAALDALIVSGYPLARGERSWIPDPTPSTGCGRYGDRIGK